MMSQPTLSTALQGMVPAGVEAQGISNFADAYETYALGAQSNLVPINAPAVTTAKAALAAAMVGVNTPGQSVAKIVAGLVAFWVSIALVPALAFTGATLVTPPAFATLTATLTATFVSNLTAELNLVDASDAIATVIHADTLVGGTATFPGPIVAPII